MDHEYPLEYPQVLIPTREWDHPLADARCSRIQLLTVPRDKPPTANTHWGALTSGSSLSYNVSERVRRIQLIGAKRKGKLIAQILKEYHCNFDWYEKDSALIGQTLINTEIKSIDFLKTEEACILSVYPDEELRVALEVFISKRGYYIGANAHYF